MTLQRLLLDRVLLPQGWHDDVGLDVEAGTIVAVEVAPADRAARTHLPGVALPGLPNLHSHTFQRGMAGLAERRGPADDSFWTWRQVMYRFLGALQPDDVEAIAAFAMMEMLERGFTALAEFHYLHHQIDGRPYDNLAELSERTAAAADATGIGLTLLPCFYANGTFGNAPPLDGQKRFINDPDRFLRLVEGARAAVAPLPDAHLGIAPHSLRAVTPETLSAVLAAFPGGPIHIHAAEQVKEVEDCLAWSGLRPVEWLLQHCAVDRDWVLIHATHMTAEEITALARSGAVAGLCPLTEASLGDGIFPGRAFLRAGGAFGIGTDSNIEISGAAELKQLEYGQRLAHLGRNMLAGEAGHSTGRRLYDGALAGGAQALGRRIGAVAPGCRADLVILDADHPDLAGLADDRLLDSHIFVSGAAPILTVLVGGRLLVEDGRHHRRDAITARYIRTMARLRAL